MIAIRQAVKLTGAAKPIAAVAQRSMTLSGVKGFSEHEKTIEDLYFTKEDQRLLGKILNKVKAQSDVADKTIAEGIKAAEVNAVKGLVSKYNISEEDVSFLLKWKHTHY
uniref:Uncharacterized protein n=1 Tax=Polytomella parva TaxID=51329 RepID=A0A7S0USD0_9CHLO|eukprot:CAMPEP_0175045622 /NCGR_PEP_ID=MMETSP0052_2-20121109/4538_1 /TAXON_ID=51329 ORGANISM="Polytomella parva, Strain SAG 63-3" /NCGR_SAMPLE_ID=MMETSP0052_2 /ASSEMBLY_ACC=CAM_ASM_000194 /LENGTH=108 /DNA_ID=CAMNT_0016309199 /DNA_START=42 /DNA_END=368 /DNA_ORIENTATION=+